MVTEHMTLHGVDVTVTRETPTLRPADVTIAIGPTWSRTVRGHGNDMYGDIAHEVRVWLLKRRRGRVS